MKFIKKTLLLALASIAILGFFSCNSGIEAIPENADGTVSVSFNVETAARTILPTVTLSSYTYTVTGKMKGETEWQTLLEKESYTKLTNTKAITVKLGEWDFAVTAYDGDNVVLYGTAATKITIDTNIISVILNAAGTGTGTVSVTVTSIPNAIKKVTAGLYDSMEAAATDSGTEQTITSGRSVVFTKDNVPVTAGNKECFVKFFLYDAANVCVNTLVESVYVVAGKTSSKSTSLSNYNTYDIEVSLAKGNSVWSNSGKTMSFRRTGATYILDFTTKNKVNIYISGGTYKIYDGEKDTGVTFIVDVDKTYQQTKWLQYYTVTPPAGCTIVSDDDNIVFEDTSYSFKVDKGYCEVTTVKAGNTELTAAADGTYTISNIASDQTIYVTGTGHTWEESTVGDKTTFTCSVCNKETMTFTKGDVINKTPENVVDYINTLPESSTFVYNIALSGEISSTTISSLKSLLKNNNKLLALDLSATTGLTSIKNDSFYQCRGLAGIVLPSTVTSIGEWAFYWCNLTSVIIPANVETIGGQAFSSCEALASVTFAEGSKLKTIDYAAFSHTALTSVEIPSGVTNIGNSAFSNCSSLATVTVRAVNPPELGSSVFPNNVTAICVPSGSVGTYQAAEGWSAYSSKISAISE